MGKGAISNWRLEVERVQIKGKPRYLWKAVDDVGEVLDIYATEGPDEAAARQFFEQTMKDPWSIARIRSGASIHRRK